MRVAIVHHGFIPTYRVRLFELLNEGADEYVVYHGVPPSNIAAKAAEGPFTFPTRWVDNRELNLMGWTAIYQPVLREVMTGGYDAVVLGHEIKFLTNLALAPLERLRGVPVLYWGFGYHVSMGEGLTSKPSGLKGRVATPIKQALTRLADGFVVYTETGAKRLAGTGYPAERIFVLRNTVDVTEQIRLHTMLEGADTAALRAKFGLRPDSIVLLYVGRLLEAKKVEQLIDATRLIAERGRVPAPVEAVIIGTGPMEASLREAAARVPGVHMTGEIYDQPTVAEYMKVASAIVIPGFVGLAVNHAFAQGRPVITRANDLHSPEIEYLVPGTNGLIVDGDFDTFVGALETFAADPALRQRLSDGALASRDGLRMEYMAEQFDQAVRTTITRKRCRNADVAA
jgi:glycosyltransferase involved in cell wall biosynthesis